MIVVVGLILAFVLVVIFSNRATRYCRWRAHRGDTATRWTCVTCGAETEGSAGTPPRVCLRDNSDN